MRVAALGIALALVELGNIGCSPRRSGGPASWTYDDGGIVRGDCRESALALIFTGGHHGEGTPIILDELQRRSAKASFFLTGDYLANLTHPPFVRRMVTEGHYVGPHSHGHPLYCDWEDRNRTLVSEAEFKTDLLRNMEELRRHGALRGEEPVFFIPPYEYYNAEQVRWSAELGAVLFNFTPGSGSNRDWIPEGERGFVPSEQIVKDVLAHESHDPSGLRGFLLLMHLGSLRADKLHARLGTLLDELARRGYRFVRVDELLHGAMPAFGEPATGR